MDKTSNEFFRELLTATEIQFKKSPIYQKQLNLNKKWNYGVCATPIIKNTGVIFGINWGGDNKLAQTQMPDGKGITKYHFIKQNRQFLEDHWDLDIATHNFNYTNLCFFRSPKARNLTLKDYELSLPLFKDYLSYINPPWVLSIGNKNLKILGLHGALQNIIQHFDKQGKFKGHSGKLWDWNIFSVPHPSARLTNESRKTIWEKVTLEMKITTNR